MQPNNSINNAFDWIVKLRIVVSYQKYDWTNYTSL